MLAGCSTVNEGGGTAAAPTTSMQTLEYYPYQVKGYQNSYPKKTILILIPTDARDVTGNAAPLNGNPAIGVITDQNGNVTERMYSTPLGPIVQGAIGRSADEAGMSASALERDRVPAEYQEHHRVRAREQDSPMLGEEGSRPEQPVRSGLADDGGFRAGRFDLQAAVQRAVLDREHQRYLRRSAGGVVRARFRGRSGHLRRAGRGAVGRADAIGGGDIPAPGLA